MQRRHHQVGSINQRLIKLKPGQKTAFPFPLMVSPWLCKRQALISSLNPYYLFVPFSIAMFSGLGFNPFFYLLFFGLFGGNFIRVSFFLCYRILRVTSNTCCLFCLALKWGLAILSVIALTTISVSKHVS